MKDLCAWLVVVILVGFSSRYSYQIWKREITPTLSTWIIFLTGTGLSLITYAIAENHDFKSGIMNTMDVVDVIIVFLATLAWGKHEKVRFKPWEKYYLMGAGAIVLYGIISGDAWKSNIFTQALIAGAYIPTIHNLVQKKRNTESFTAWGLGLLANIVALYPAMDKGNSLAVVYAARSIVLIIIMLSFMWYYRKPLTDNFKEGHVGNCNDG